MKSLAEEKIELDALLQEIKSAKRLMDEAEEKCKETDAEIEDLKKMMSFFGGDEAIKLYHETGQIIAQIQRNFECQQQQPTNQNLKREYLDLIKKKDQMISEKNTYYNPKLHPELCKIRERLEETKQQKVTWGKIFSQRKEEYNEKDAIYQKKKSFIESLTSPEDTKIKFYLNKLLRLIGIPTNSDFKLVSRQGRIDLYYGGQWHPDGVNHGHITAVKNEDDYDVSYRRNPNCNVS